MAVPRLLWRKVEKATLDSLNGISGGQYHIALARPPGIEDFFSGLPQLPKKFKGYSVQVPLEAAPGPPSVPAQALTVYFNGWDASRREWRIPSQRPASAYPLWRPGVGPQPGTPLGDDMVVLLRDENDLFHARWLYLSERGQLPAILRGAIGAAETGVRVLTPHELAAFRAVASIPSTARRISPRAPTPPAPPVSLGNPYQPVPTPPPSAQSPAPFATDPDVIDRGVKAHIDTQNALAAHVHAGGLAPLQPDSSMPPYDLAWEYQGVFFVAEVKSITTANEEQQLRLGLGQLLRYAHALRSAGVDPVQPVLVAERQPRDRTWLGTCSGLDVTLTWPGRFAQNLGI
jgi:hypothetical protein